ncbi:hypothetical protein HD806DRAFT_518366 [Xylariaceae sp. AK1471]|nr:hypothetical protein HD806DRAFT_518366 [Xylariaceae sp. AK1471]
MGLEGIYRDFHPLQPNHNQFQQGPPPQQMPQQNPSGAHQHNGQGNQQKAQQGNQQQPQKGNQQQPQRGNQQQPQKGNKQARHGGSDSDSGSESCSSSCSSSSGSPPTSVSERQGRGHHKDHNHVRVPGNHPHPHVPRHEGPRGYRPSGSPRLQRVSVSPHHSPRAPGPPHPPTREGSVASHIERVRDDAYQRGRMAGMSDARLVEELAQSKIHARPRPRIIQEQSPPRLLRVRTDMDDIPRQFTRLSVYDDDLGDVGLRREDTRRRREFEYRAQRGSILDEDPFESPPSPSSYTTYSTDGRRRGPQIIEIPERYPRSPGPRRARDFY